MQSKDDKDTKSPKKGKDRIPTPNGRSDAEDPKDASSASAPVAEKKEEEHKTPPRPAAKPKPKPPDAASLSLAIGSDNCLVCQHRKAIMNMNTGGIIDSSLEFPIERAPSFDELVASIRLEDAAGISLAEICPQEPPPTSTTTTSTRSYMTNSPSPSGGSVLVLGSLSIPGERQATSKETEHLAAKPPMKPEEQTGLCSAEGASSRVFDPNLEFDQERDDLFTLLRFTISCPHSTLEEIKAQVEKILERGYTLDTPTSSSITPLMMAALENRVDVANLLLDYGADPNTSRAYMSNYTALHVACMHSGDCNSLPMVTLLLQRGANLRALTAKGDNPLTIACLYGSPVVVNYIVLYTRQNARVGKKN